MLVATLVISGREWLWPLATFLAVALLALAWAYSRAAAGGTIRGVCIFLKSLGLLTLAACLLEPLWSGERAKPGRDGDWLCEGATVGLPQFQTLHVYDVAREWWQMTERPAVLAVWAARPEIATESLADEFLASLNYGLANLDAICKESATELNLPAKELKLYLKTNIDYSLDDENRKGLLAYYSHAVKLGLIEKLSPITIAARTGVPARTIDFSWVKSPAAR